MAIGEFAADDITGYRESGSGRPTRELTGAIRTTTIINVGGRCMKAIGTTKIMAITTTTVTIAITVAANPRTPRFADKEPSPGSLFLHAHLTQFVLAAAVSSSPAK